MAVTRNNKIQKIFNVFYRKIADLNTIKTAKILQIVVIIINHLAKITKYKHNLQQNRNNNKKIMLVLVQKVKDLIMIFKINLIIEKLDLVLMIQIIMAASKIILVIVMVIISNKVIIMIL